MFNWVVDKLFPVFRGGGFPGYLFGGFEPVVWTVFGLVSGRTIGQQSLYFKFKSPFNAFACLIKSLISRPGLVHDVFDIVAVLLHYLLKTLHTL